MSELTEKLIRARDSMGDDGRRALTQEHRDTLAEAINLLTGLEDPHAEGGGLAAWALTAERIAEEIRDLPIPAHGPIAPIREAIAQSFSAAFPSEFDRAAFIARATDA